MGVVVRNYRPVIHSTYSFSLVITEPSGVVLGIFKREAASQGGSPLGVLSASSKIEKSF